jgi:3-keto-5-aminohexanoate cleavage enzyme
VTATTDAPAIITVAITGSLPQKADNPAVPISPAEQIESTHQAYEAGASIVHIHVRNPDGSVSSSADLFQEVQLGVKRHCPDMIVQFSTGGRGRDQSERGAALRHRPEMASLSTGTVNFVESVYENHPGLIRALAGEMLENDIKPEIEIFDLSLLYAASRYADAGLIRRPMHVQFVMGMPGVLPFRRSVFDFLLSELRATEPDATWGVMGIGRDQLEANRWSLEAGGHIRTGFEDNVRFDRTRLAVSNAELVARAAELVVTHGRTVATPAQARAILGLPPA